jgi:hypothetical protein
MSVLTRLQRARRERASRGRPAAHFLHIGKTGGTAIRHALEQTPSSRYRIVVHRHADTVLDVPPGEPFFFVVRDPLTRYVSAFNSRLRQGLPRYHVPWSEDEATAFARFETPGGLARALSSDDPEEAGAARTAMRSIRHVSTSYWDWLVDQATLDARRDDILFVGFQEQLDTDFAILARRLGLPPSSGLPTDDRAAHRAPSDVVRDLDDLAVTNLRAWYAADIDFIERCRSIRAASAGDLA